MSRNTLKNSQNIGIFIEALEDANIDHFPAEKNYY